MADKQRREEDRVRKESEFLSGVNKSDIEKQRLYEFFTEGAMFD